MSTVIILPLEKNKDLAALVADKEMGDRLYTCGTIKAKDDQTLTLRIEEVTDKVDDLPKPGEHDDDEDAEEKASDGQSNGSTPGETEEADELASPGGYMGP